MTRRPFEQPDLISTIEACYRVDQTSEDWLRGVLESLAWLDQGLGIFGFTYTLSPSLTLIPGPIVEVGCPARVSEVLNLAFQNGPEFNRASYLEGDVGAASAMPGYLSGPIDLAARERGIFDSWGINGRNWGGPNAVVIVNRNAVMAPDPRVAALLHRVAIHLAVGARLQRRLQTSACESTVEAALPSSGISKTSALSSRERQVVASAGLGRSNKEIAYDLGLAHTTVRVLLARAAKKLGLHSRSEIVKHIRNADSPKSSG